MKRLILALAALLLAAPLFGQTLKRTKDGFTGTVLPNGTIIASAVNTPANQPLLTWTASVTAGAGYRIYRGLAPGQESTTSINPSPVAVGCSGATCTYTDTDATLVPGTTYYYVLRAVLGTQNSPVSNEASVMIPIVVVIPAAPTGLTITITSTPPAAGAAAKRRVK